MKPGRLTVATAVLLVKLVRELVRYDVVVFAGIGGVVLDAARRCSTQGRSGRGATTCLPLPAS